MANTAISIIVPESLKAFIDAQIEAGFYGNPSDYFRELALDDRDRRMSRLKQRLLENLKSDPVSFSEEELAQSDFVELCRRKLQEAR